MPGDLVLLHGFAQTGASWDPVTRALGGRYRAAAPDLRGHGARADARPVSFPAVIGDLDELVPRGATLAGYSMGGRIALAYALERPGRVSRLVLVGASPGLADVAEREARRAADEALAERIEREGVEAFADEWEAQPLFVGRPAGVAEAARAERLRQSPLGLAAALRGLGTGAMEPLWDRLAEMLTPVTLIAGEHDGKFRAIAERMAERLPDARLQVVAGAGHAVHLEQPEAFDPA